MLKPIGSLKIVDETETELVSDIGKYYNDPLGFVKYVYCWGEGELKDSIGPDLWQSVLLQKITDELKSRESDNALETALRIAVSSGHGVGKSGLVSWLVWWFLSTRPMCQIVVTANTQGQLSTKTWREANKWMRLAINRHHYVWTATKIYHTLYPEVWFASAIPWAKDNSEAFAGTHAKDVLIVFDEASAIDEAIWTVVEGALTTKGAMFFAFGNPTQTKGNFFDCFNSMSHRWTTYRVDSRNAKMANQAQILEWIADYGEDSDFVKVRIKGEFPRQSSSQFISTELVMDSWKRPIQQKDYASHPVIIGVDVARYGDDKSIIIKRQGNWVDPPLKFSGIDTMELASRVVEAFRKAGNNGVVCVDGIGVGAGVVDRLKRLGINVIDCQSAENAYDQKTYRNRRGEYWGRMRDWLQAGGRIPNDEDLKKQLASVEYGFNNKLQIQLQTKEDMRKHGNASPDVADALAYSFAYDDLKLYSTRATARVIRQVTWL